MELKDVILSTLAEMEEIVPAKDDLKPANDFKQKTNYEQKIEYEYKIEHEHVVEHEHIIKVQPPQEEPQEQSSSNEMIFLTSIRERMLVLFEGFQAPNNTNIEAKVDMTLNFLEYVLVSIDTRVNELEKGAKK